jgi:muramoyltetrapeptide carboxypeptidase LdcA involved in peptidoglycan recycling
MKLVKPPMLRPGDTVAAVSPSWGGPGTFPQRYEAGKRQFEEAFGVRVIEMPHTLKEADWLHAHPEARARDLMDAFRDPSIKALIATIGGDESVRLLPYLDLDVIRRHPKILLGYSDTTFLHLACLKAGISSFYGPSFMSGFAENTGIFPYMADSVRRTLFSKEPIGRVGPNPEGWTVEHLDWADAAHQARRRKLQPSAPWKVLQGSGVSSGHLIGGCIDALEQLKATAVWPSPEQWKGAVIFFESSEEAPSPSHVARWLRNYAAQGIFQNAAAVLVGRPGGQIPESQFAAYDDVFLKIIRNELGLSELPIMTRMDFGHTDPFFTLPYGARVEVRCDEACLYFPEASVIA